jgi:hypothetical protein
MQTSSLEKYVPLLHAAGLLSATMTGAQMSQIAYFISVDSVVYALSDGEQFDPLDAVGQMSDIERAALRTRVIEKVQNAPNVLSR